MSSWRWLLASNVPGIYLRLEGEPAVKQRPRVTLRAGKPHAYTPAKTKQAEADIRWEFRRQVPGFGDPVTCPVHVRLVFYTRSQAKDVDNLAKLVLDALNNLCWADDRQVERLEARIVRGKKMPPGTLVDVRWGVE